MQISAKSDYGRIIRPPSESVGLTLAACECGRSISALKGEALESEAVALRQKNLTLRHGASGAMSKALI